MPGDTPKTARSGAHGESESGRRSKFVVLQQSINTIKALQLRCAAQESELAQLRGRASAAAGAGIAAGSGVAAASAARAGGARSSGSGAADAAGGGGAALPDVPASAPPGVDVQAGSEPGTCYVRVACVDRRGLLADILNALRAMPLEVVRAAITTSPDGNVNDVFELRGAPDAVRPAEIKAAVERQLLAAAAGKRRR